MFTYIFLESPRSGWSRGFRNDLHLPGYVLNWLMHFFSNKEKSQQWMFFLYWTKSVTDQSRFGPRPYTLYIIHESDLKPVSKIKMIFKYANDSNLIKPGSRLQMFGYQMNLKPSKYGL